MGEIWGEERLPEAQLLGSSYRGRFGVIQDIHCRYTQLQCDVTLLENRTHDY